MGLESLFTNLPEVSKPIKKLSLKEKLIWTLVVLVLYFVLCMLPLYGLSPSYVSQFETMAILLAASFGSIITLGIGPLVTGSIMLQLLTGAGIIQVDTKTPEGRKKYQGYQKMFSIFFIVFENAAYVISGALPPTNPGWFNIMLLIIQLVVGGLLLMLLDELTSKWGVGSGISLFIAAGVSREMFTNAISPMIDPRTQLPIGAIPKIITLISHGNGSLAFWPFISLVATAIVFIMAIYFSGIQINIPLSFGKVRGFGIKWPIKWFYTSNIPVILTAALLASLQFWALMMFKAGVPLLGAYEEVSVGAGKFTQQPISGLAHLLQHASMSSMFEMGMSIDTFTSILFYAGFMIVGSVFFAYLWINVGKASPSDVADQILSSGLSIPGFRRDKRILEKILARYIVPLALLGGVTVGVLATIADVLGALSRGTGILLTVMIIYQFYEQIQKHHMEEMNPMMSKVMG
ncbi:MAG: preprotein translocase subunit SecY [Candidatus Nanoarchaeia archaeon]|nr:preprotein translocase subunit SecY [Candidatus Nanoarchaeia archaeon]MDD5239648.1 preprotein translocase subunit SecY [Candidatus Nanoarchaeia archaeon]